jgi:hypothetical protein
MRLIIFQPTTELMHPANPSPDPWTAPRYRHLVRIGAKDTSHLWGRCTVFHVFRYDSELRLNEAIPLYHRGSTEECGSPEIRSDSFRRCMASNRPVRICRCLFFANERSEAYDLVRGRMWCSKCSSRPFSAPVPILALFFVPDGGINGLSQPAPQHRGPLHRPGPGA